jgi:NAD(P)-dependent dehydrogenase (short-subunit alcohol dehydrogenase family)
MHADGVVRSGRKSNVAWRRGAQLDVDPHPIPHSARIAIVQSCPRTVRSCATARLARRMTGHARREEGVARYADKKAVVTGGTIGMGLAIAKALVDEGAEVLLTGRDQTKLDIAQRELRRRAHAVRSDAGSLTDIAALAAHVRNRLGRIDALFINAGHCTMAMLEQVTEADYDQTFAINTKGPYFTVQQLAPLINDGGALVFTTSVADEVGYPGMSVYAGTKAALRSFAQGFAAELLDRGIRANALSPGFVKTPTMGLTAASDEERAAFELEGAVSTPMKRIASAEEVARAALFLAFEATFTTGTELVIDGGLTTISLPHQ